MLSDKKQQNTAEENVYRCLISWAILPCGSKYSFPRETRKYFKTCYALIRHTDIRAICTVHTQLIASGEKRQN